MTYLAERPEDHEQAAEEIVHANASSTCTRGQNAQQTINPSDQD